MRPLIIALCALCVVGCTHNFDGKDTTPGSVSTLRHEGGPFNSSTETAYVSTVPASTAQRPSQLAPVYSLYRGSYGYGFYGYGYQPQYYAYPGVQVLR